MAIIVNKEEKRKNIALSCKSLLLRITSYNVCYTKLLRVGVMLLIIPWLLSIGLANESVADVHHEVSSLNSKQKRLYWILGILAFILIFNTFMKEIMGFALDEKRNNFV